MDETCVCGHQPDEHDVSPKGHYTDCAVDQCACFYYEPE